LRSVSAAALAPTIRSGDNNAADRAATRQLMQSIKATAPGHVRIIFFNDPTLISEGLTTEWPAHDNHLHVRFCEKVHPDSLYTC
jgi:hypothetical protein